MDTIEGVTMEGVVLNVGTVNLPAMLYSSSEGAFPKPAIVVGPGGIQNGIIKSIEWLAIRLAKAGFVVLTITWRSGSPIDDPKDIAAAITWLENQPEVRSECIGIFGMSRGGMSALRAAADEDRLRAVVTFGSPTDLLQHVRAVISYAPGRYAVLVKWLGGEPDTNRPFYEEVQPISHAARIRQPVLSIHGAFDMHVPPEQSIWMIQELKRFGNRNAAVEIVPGMNHYTDMVPDYVFGFDRVASPAVAFFKMHLGEESGNEAHDA